MNPVVRFRGNKITQSHNFLLGYGVNRATGWGCAFIQHDFRRKVGDRRVASLGLTETSREVRYSSGILLDHRDCRQLSDPDRRE